ncbi:glycosyltransferase [uncultured Bacteroides sp.]|jgi:glycosyltransferase involved in cell wall biosynthesis|uniref:glycosyltransferase n=1 Tax=uncultured Bacteroides sp. TaxID=162156 RepID=UPI0025D601AB|nr:glycosyltransferase [uncultured Bacteroides sp.]
MNLLYISNNSNSVDGGLNWSVPASVKAQQKYDNVLWVDLTVGAFQKHWGEVKAYHNIKDFGDRISLSILPSPFNHPDCVVFEGFYYFEHVRFAKELYKNDIPYVIIPRGSFTKSSFHNGSVWKFLKKKIAHLLFFNSYIYRAAAVQYLTKTEKLESDRVFALSSFILPNGITMPDLKKDKFNDKIRGVFIGRQDILHKGIDLLFESIKDLKSELRNAGFHLDIYGPPRYDVKKVSQMISDLDISDLVYNHEVGVSGKDKENVLLSSDVFFLTSRFEGHPMGLIEALAYGVPVFITRGANMLDEVKESGAGWTCEIDKDDLKRTLLQMINDCSNLSQYSKNARDLASNYDWDKLALLFHDEIAKITNIHKTKM